MLLLLLLLLLLAVNEQEVAMARNRKMTWRRREADGLMILEEDAAIISDCLQYWMLMLTNYC